MRLRIFCVILTVLVLALLVGCNTTVSEPEHPYTVTLPESWGNRAAVVHLDDGVDIAVDGLPILNFRLVENIPGARERADELIVDGYQWDYTIETANNKYFYFFDAILILAGYQKL